MSFKCCILEVVLSVFFVHGVGFYFKFIMVINFVLLIIEIFNDFVLVSLFFVLGLVISYVVLLEIEFVILLFCVLMVFVVLFRVSCFRVFVKI